MHGAAQSRMDDRSGTSSEPITLVEPEKASLGEHGNVHSLLLQYADETREQLEAIANPVPDTRHLRRVYWALGVVAVLVLAGVWVGVMALMRGDSAAQYAARALALHEQELCTHRQEAVMRAIAQYIQDHQEAPEDLSVLRPPYLTVAPVDPVSGVPYQYRRNGNAVWLSCSQHPLPSVVPSH